MHLNLEKHINYSNVHQTTFLFIFTKVSKLIIKGTDEVLFMWERVVHSEMLLLMP